MPDLRVSAHAKVIALQIPARAVKRARLREGVEISKPVHKSDVGDVSAPPLPMRTAMIAYQTQGLGKWEKIRTSAIVLSPWAPLSP